LFIKKDDNQNKLILKADIFFNDELDKNFYETVIDFFELENHYEECCIIHNKWAECRKRVEQESHEFYTGTFWKSFLAKIEPAKIDVHTNKALLP
jgi:hypothetical protein